jgi:hypothetical protein
MSLDRIYTFDLTELQFLDGDFKDSDSFEDLIYEGDGSSELEFEWISFNLPGEDFEVVVEYTLSLSGTFTNCPGDYWTPPSCDFDLDEANVIVTKILIDDIESCVSKDVENFFVGLVEKKIGI